MDSNYFVDFDVFSPSSVFNSNLNKIWKFRHLVVTLNWKHKGISLYVPNTMSIGWMVLKVEGRVRLIRTTFLGLCLLGLKRELCILVTFPKIHLRTILCFEFFFSFLNMFPWQPIFEGYVSEVFHKNVLSQIQDGSQKIQDSIWHYKWLNSK